MLLPAAECTLSSSSTECFDDAPPRTDDMPYVPDLDAVEKVPLLLLLDEFWLPREFHVDESLLASGLK